MWFMILTASYESNPKAIVWNGSEKFMSVKVHILKKTSVAKLFKHIENKNWSARSTFAALKNRTMLNVSLTETEQNN